MNKTSILVGLALVCVVGAAALIFLTRQVDVSETDEFSAPGFGETEEDVIYDTLASVTYGDALEYLYLERVGAMAGGGLEEADQTIHEIKLLDTKVAREGDRLAINASWQVIGTVGHAEHLHVRGNTYSADLSVSPIEKAWRITDFELLEVNRDAAGETFLAPQTN
jgi:hypothetical protein